MHNNDPEEDFLSKDTDSLAIDPNTLVVRVLRDLYVSVQEEAIPPHLLDLLERLDKAENNTSNAEAP